MLDVMKLEYKLHQERENRRLETLVITKFEWRSKELKREFRGIDTKVNTAMSERGKRMMVAREMGSCLPYQQVLVQVLNVVGVFYQ